MNSNIKGFNILKGLMIILIFLSHCGSFSFLYTESIWGAAGVNCFFVLSGFLSQYHYKNNYSLSLGIIKDKYLHFLNKFYIVYFIMLVLYTFIYVFNLSKFIKCFLLIQSYFFDTNIATSYNGNAWFLSTLMLPYVFSPLINKFVIEKNNRLLFFVALIMFIIQLVLPFVFINNFDKGYYYVYIFPLVRLFDYYYGCILYKKIKSNNTIIGIIDNKRLVYYILSLIYIFFVKYINVRLLQYNVAWLPFSIILILLFYNYEDVFNNRIINVLVKLIDIIGMNSFYIFISHRFVMLCVLKFDYGIIGFLITIVLTCIFVIFLKKIDYILHKYKKYIYSF